MTYYVRAAGIIRRFIRSNRNQATVEADLKELEALLPLKKGAALTKVERNIHAVRQYLRLYGQRQFTLLSIPKCRLNTYGVLITASPDLHVEEHGIELLIKFDFCRTREDEAYIPLMLQIVRDASRKSGLRVRARNIIVFDVGARKEHHCPPSRAPLKRVFSNACREITKNWDDIV